MDAPLKAPQDHRRPLGGAGHRLQGHQNRAAADLEAHLPIGQTQRPRHPLGSRRRLLGKAAERRRPTGGLDHDRRARSERRRGGTGTGVVVRERSQKAGQAGQAGLSAGSGTAGLGCPRVPVQERTAVEGRWQDGRRQRGMGRGDTKLRRRRSRMIADGELGPISAYRRSLHVGESTVTRSPTHHVPTRKAWKSSI